MFIWNCNNFKHSFNTESVSMHLSLQPGALLSNDSSRWRSMHTLHTSIVCHNVFVCEPNLQLMLSTALQWQGSVTLELSLNPLIIQSNKNAGKMLIYCVCQDGSSQPVARAGQNAALEEAGSRDIRAAAAASLLVPELAESRKVVDIRLASKACICHCWHHFMAFEVHMIICHCWYYGSSL